MSADAEADGPGFPGLVIFDLDGTLVDSLAPIARAMNTALEEAGRAARPLEDYRRFVGDGARILARRLLGPEAVEDIVESSARRFREVYAEAGHEGTHAYPGMRELLSRLRAAGARLAVLSNKPDALAAACAEHVFGREVFAEVVGQREGVPPKPAPDGLIGLLARIGADARRVVYVGDTATDAATARAAGLKMIGVAWGFRGPAELVAAGVKRIATDADELERMITGVA